MRLARVVLPVLLLLGPGSAAWADPPPAAHLDYELYAGGLHVAHVEASIGAGPRSYRMKLAYQTTGMVGFFYRGHQFNSVSGSWRSDRAEPDWFYGAGTWRGEDRVARIDYDRGMPMIRQLVPPNETEREPVPFALQAHSIDTLSALLELVHTVERTGRCDTTVRTYDGRRATEIAAHTAGQEVLQRTSRSTFAGPALRCDFIGRMLAGFKLDDDPAKLKPLHGSAWMAQIVPGVPPLPTRMTFETRWFGDATMYLASARQEPVDAVATR